MSFRVKLRIKNIKTNPDLLRRLVEAARREAEQKPSRYQDDFDRVMRMPKGNECVPSDDWVRRWQSPNLTDLTRYGNLPSRGPNSCFLWNGVSPINGGVQ